MSVSQQSVAAFKNKDCGQVNQAGGDKRGPTGCLAAGNHLNRPIEHRPEAACVKDPEPWKGKA